MTFRAPPCIYIYIQSVRSSHSVTKKPTNKVANCKHILLQEQTRKQFHILCYRNSFESQSECTTIVLGTSGETPQNAIRRTRRKSTSRRKFRLELIGYNENPHIGEKLTQPRCQDMARKVAQILEYQKPRQEIFVIVLKKTKKKKVHCMFFITGMSVDLNYLYKGRCKQIKSRKIAPVQMPSECTDGRRRAELQLV